MGEVAVPVHHWVSFHHRKRWLKDNDTPDGRYRRGKDPVLARKERVLPALRFIFSCCLCSNAAKFSVPILFQHDQKTVTYIS